MSYSCNPWTVALPASLSLGFCRQEYWSGLPCPPPGDLPDLGTEAGCPALQADSLPIELPVKPLVRKGCEHVTIKKAECQRTDGFELWCWRRLLRLPWTVRRSNQSILKEISPEYSLKGLMLKLKLQYFGHMMWIADSLEKTLMLGKTEGRRRRGDSGQDSWVASLTQCTCIWLTPGDGEGRACCDSLWGCKEPDRIEQLNNNDRDC